MANPIFADPFGSLLSGIRQGREDNLNEARLAADVQAEQNRLRAQALDRALRVTLAQEEQRFNLASQQAQFAEQRSLQQDQNQFTLGVEAQRELTAARRQQQDQQFRLQLSTQEAEQAAQLEGTRNEFALGRLDRTQQFTAGQNAANRAQQTQVAITRLESVERQGALDRAQQVELANLRAEQAVTLAQLPPTAAQTTADLQGRAVSAGTLVVNPDGTLAQGTAPLTPQQEATNEFIERGISSGSLRVSPDGTVTEVGGSNNLSGFVDPTGAPAPPTPTGLSGFTDTSAAAPPVGLSPSPALPPPPVSPTAVAATRAPGLTGSFPTVGGQSLGAAAADVSSTQTRLAMGEMVPNTPEFRAEVLRISTAPATSPSAGRARRNALLWLRRNGG